MKLLTDEIREKAMSIDTDFTPDMDMKDSPIMVKFYDPLGSKTWYAFDGDPVIDNDGNEVDYLFLGYVITSNQCTEDYILECFSLKYLESRTIYGLGIARDLSYLPGKVLFGDTPHGKEVQKEKNQERDKVEEIIANMSSSGTRFYSNELTLFAVLPDGRTFFDNAKNGAGRPEFIQSGATSTEIEFGGNRLPDSELLNRYPWLFVG